MSRRTIYTGIHELEAMGDDDPEHPRRPSGDEKRVPVRVADELFHRDYEVCRNTAAALLERAGFRRRSLCKALITGHVDPQKRDRQSKEKVSNSRSSAQGGKSDISHMTIKREQGHHLADPDQ